MVVNNVSDPKTSASDERGSGMILRFTPSRNQKSSVNISSTDVAVDIKCFIKIRDGINYIIKNNVI